MVSGIISLGRLLGERDSIKGLVKFLQRYTIIFPSEENFVQLSVLPLLASREYHTSNTYEVLFEEI